MTVWDAWKSQTSREFALTPRILSMNFYWGLTRKLRGRVGDREPHLVLQMFGSRAAATMKKA